MRLYSEIANIKNSFSSIAVALGTFDGVHIGHQHIIGKATEWAKHNQGASVVFTFSNHPLSIIAPEHSPRLIYSTDTKAKFIEAMGVDVLLNIPFTPELLHLLPTDFIDILVSNLNPRKVIVGPNYSFGYQGSGTPEMLQEAGNKFGFEVEIHPVVLLNDVVVSSTLIRQLLMQGKVREANSYLGRNYGMYGMTVIAGEQRGRKLGYPTANLAVPSGMVVPADGVYAVKVQYESNIYSGVANVGCNPTFLDNGIKRIEVHILDFSRDIYHKSLDIIFYERLRDELRFDNPGQLKAQINKDIEAAQTLLF
jgi:riboflavin kinase/FMN adenylyltransferase